MNLIVDIPTRAMEEEEGAEGLRSSEMEIKMREQASKRFKVMSYSLSRARLVPM